MHSGRHGMGAAGPVHSEGFTGQTPQVPALRISRKVSGLTILAPAYSPRVSRSWSPVTIESQFAAAEQAMPSCSGDCASGHAKCSP